MFKLRPKKYAWYYLNFNTVFLVGLTSALSIHPFDNHFRFTFGVTMLSILLLYFPRLSVITIASLSALLIMVSRMIIYILTDNYINLFTSIMFSLPTLCYYIILVWDFIFYVFVIIFEISL